jgi:hypothetical protein
MKGVKFRAHTSLRAFLSQAYRKRNSNSILRTFNQEGLINPCHVTKLLLGEWFLFLDMETYVNILIKFKRVLCLLFFYKAFEQRLANSAVSVIIIHRFVKLL